MPSMHERQSVLLATAHPITDEQKVPAISPILHTHYLL